MPDGASPEGPLLAKLRGGDEAAFAALVDGLNCRLQALAATFTSSSALAEDIVQETWLGVIRGLDGFEGRSSLRTWIFSILIRRARTLAAREARRADAGSTNGAAAEEWDLGRGRVGLWEAAPEPWALDTPEQVLQGREALEIVRAALDGLPESQRQVVLLRDVEGVSPSDICNILDLTETNMRVLLHRGRARIRRALDLYLREGTRPSTAPTPVQETR
ncbi:MAG TPA: RNA polymerase sigma factor [Candidatus Eisenbacteria bacterium]|nr:RNA polymerase sigma factor [Candidatus Eisenbacteria bacterium]